MAQNLGRLSKAWCMSSLVSSRPRANGRFDKGAWMQSFQYGWGGAFYPNSAAWSPWLLAFFLCEGIHDSPRASWSLGYENWWNFSATWRLKEWLSSVQSRPAPKVMFFSWRNTNNRSAARSESMERSKQLPVMLRRIKTMESSPWSEGGTARFCIIMVDVKLLVWSIVF